MDNSFDLPKLPLSRHFYHDENDRRAVKKPCNLYTADQMQAYARAAVEAEREACAKICDTTPPSPFRASIEAAHAIRARGKS